MLAPTSQACIRAAFCIYGAILTEIERLDYNVFAGRAVVPKIRRLGMAARCLATRTGAPVAVPGRPADPARVPLAAALAAQL
jgi:phytoene synthase